GLRIWGGVLSGRIGVYVRRLGWIRHSRSRCRRIGRLIDDTRTSRVGGPPGARRAWIEPGWQPPSPARRGVARTAILTHNKVLANAATAAPQTRRLWCLGNDCERTGGFGHL